MENSNLNDHHFCHGDFGCKACRDWERDRQLPHAEIRTSPPDRFQLTKASDHLASIIRENIEAEKTNHYDR